MAVSAEVEIVVADTTRSDPSLPGTTLTETVAPSLVVGREPSASGTILVPTRRTLVVYLAEASLVAARRPGGCSRMIVWTTPVILWGVGVLDAVSAVAVGTDRATSTANGMSCRRLLNRIRTTCSCPPTPRRWSPVRGQWPSRGFRRSPASFQGQFQPNYRKCGRSP